MDGQEGDDMILDRDSGSASQARQYNSNSAIGSMAATAGRGSVSDSKLGN